MSSISDCTKHFQIQNTLSLLCKKCGFFLKRVKLEWWTPIEFCLCSCAAVTNLTGTFAEYGKNNIATRPDQNPPFPKNMLLKFYFDTKELPRFCTAAIKSRWRQDKTITGRKCGKLSHHVVFLNRNQIFVVLPMPGKDLFPSAFITPATY